ncbi:ABC transporter permease [Emticicia agri]|uniref:FtsX-like permease family protein n=1 Tax=Emticicia agri TaxID=2492393 RepID=A0A4Q5M6F2_9BACT|nr:ABC transporter permease [Emticicia agri]RYU97587.1 FtsX-like permease family protein [Emticicia agri]
MKLKFTLRVLNRNKLFTFLNIAGLALGMAGGILVFQLVKYHLSVDTYHKNADRIYRAVVDLHLGDGQIERSKGSAYILHSTLKKEYPAIEQTSYLAHRPLTIAVTDKRSVRKYLEKESAAFTNADYFRIFDFTWEIGTPAVLDEPNKVVLTERYAEKFFGIQNPIGKSMKLENQQEVVVAGIIKDYPANTDFKTDIFVSLPTIKTLMPNYGYEDWGWIESSRETFVMLRSKDQKESFEKQMPAFSKKYHGADSEVFKYHLQNLSDIHFNVDYGGTIKKSTINLLLVIGVLMVIIACINFINLSTALSFKRYKEVGVRKTLGSSQGQIFWQFISETAVVAVFSIVLAVVLASVAAPMLSQWLKTPLSITLLSDFKLIGFLVLLLITIVFIAGFYPAMVIANFNPLKALKNITELPKRFTLRKGLVVTQFSIACILIAVSLLVVLQLNYLKNKDLGLRKDMILHVNIPNPEVDKLTTFKNQLLQQANIENVSFFRTAPSSKTGSGGSIKYENRDWEKFVARSKMADEAYIDTYGIKLVAGRKPVASDTLRELMVNEKMVKNLGLKSPEEILNKKLLVGDLSKTGTIVGVVADFNNTDLYTGVEPTVIMSARALYRYAAIQLKGYNPNTVQDIAKIWEQLYPDNVFEYTYFKDDVARFYEREELISNLTKTFAALAVFISCLGLFGLATFSIKQRTKEIGIRKVLGASVFSITALLSKDFLQLVLISILIAAPIAYYFMAAWLKDFAYRVSIEWWIFAATGIVAVIIALLTISYQAIKAALANPVKSLKTE